MTDLELTRLAAEAMGYQRVTVNALARPGLGANPPYVSCSFTGTSMDAHYDPLHDDAQAMALVKRFEISIAWSWASQVGCMAKEEARHDEDKRHDNMSCVYKDLNRAIVECCALMWHRQKELGFTSR